MTHWPFHHWTDDEREIVRRDYRHTHRSARELGARFGRSEFAVRGLVSRMGLCGHRNRRAWSDAEDERLRALMERYATLTVARRMRRSVCSVVTRAKRLGISRRSRFGWYTKTEVCLVLGVDHHWLQRRIDSGALPATWHNGRRPEWGSNASWHIAQEDLRCYIRQYPEELNGRNLDVVQVVEILAGLEEVKRR